MAEQRYQAVPAKRQSPRRTRRRSERQRLSRGAGHKYRFSRQ